MLERTLLVEPGQQQQVLDQQTHSGGLVLDPAHQMRDVQLLVGRAPSGRARRSHGSTSAAYAARGWRRRRTAASVPRTLAPAVASPARARTRSRSATNILLSAADSRPTSVRSGSSGTRWVRSPSAMAAAVCSTLTSGRSERLITTIPPTPISTSTASTDSGSSRITWWMVWLTSVSEVATTTLLPSSRTTVTTRHEDLPSARRHRERVRARAVSPLRSS